MAVLNCIACILNGPSRSFSHEFAFSDIVKAVECARRSLCTLLPYQFGILDLAVASIGCVRCCTVRESSQRALFQKRKYLANGTAVKVVVIWLYKHQLKIQSGLKRGVVI